MIRKEGDRNKRSKNFPTTYVGNNRQMLQEIRDNLSHLLRTQTSESLSSSTKSESMQIKQSDGPGGGAQGPLPGGDQRSTNPAAKSQLYRQKALAEIRNSLLPFANENGSSSAASTVSNISSNTTSGISSASGLSNTSGSSSPCQSIEHNGLDKDSLFLRSQHVLGFTYEEDGGTRGLKLGSNIRHNGDASSVDHLYKFQLESQQNGLPKQGSGLSSIASKIRRKPSFENNGREINLNVHRRSPALESSTASTRSDSPSITLSSITSRSTLDSSCSSRTGGMQIASLSPEAAAHLGAPRGFVYKDPPPPPPPRGPLAPPPTPPRGTTPPPPPTQQSDLRLVSQSFLPSSQQVQHLLKRISPAPPTTRPSPGMGYCNQLSQNSNNQRGTSPVSLGRSPMVVQNNLQVQLNHQIQSAIYNGGVGQMESPIFSISSSQHIGSSGLGMKLATPPPPTYTPGAASRQIADYSAVSSQLQQKRSSPTSYPQQIPSDCISTSLAAGSSAALKPTPLQAWSARQFPPIMLSVKSTQVQKPVLQTAVAPTAPPTSNSHLPPCYSVAVQQKVQEVICQPNPTNAFVPAAVTHQLISSAAQFSNGHGVPVVPTTDPPSYASTMQALAAQRGYTPLQFSASTTPTCSTNTSLTSSLDSSSQTAGGGECNQLMVQRKFSPTTNQSCSSTTSRPASPTQTMAGQSEVDYLPNSNEPQQESSAPTSYKMTIQSPIPERKVQSKEKEEERRETKVRNYSPQAFKFYMEQHVENVLKSHQQRLHRRLQLETEMAKVGLSEEAQCQMRKMLHQKESNYIRLKRAKMDKAMFVKIKAIGVGAFGEVALVRKVDTNHLYAMKTLRKAYVLKRNQVAHVKAERDILAEADNEWVVKLYYSFQDKDNLYFVMDYIPGGDLMSLLIKYGIFQEQLARFYIAELVCAVESVHKMGFIHRDIKPDNILIDRDGHIKLTDFGLCTGFRWTHNSKYYQNGDHSRQDSMEPDENWTNECRCNSSTNLKPLERRRRREHQRCLAHSLVGTPNYIAPEVLMRTGYTQLCDWWSVGVILYEMLVGQPPFLANSPVETQHKVINWETTLKIPKLANLSPEAADLTMKLCTSHDRRLGKNGPGEVKAHTFFSNIDFDGGIRRQRAPYIPTIRHATDTSNFDPVDPDKLHNSDSSDGDEMGNSCYDNGKHPEHAFFEFTFRRFFDDGGHAYPTRPLDDEDNQGPVYV